MTRMTKVLALMAMVALIVGCTRLKLHDRYHPGPPHQHANHPLGGPPGQLKRAPHGPGVSVEVEVGTEISRSADHPGRGHRGR